VGRKQTIDRNAVLDAAEKVVSERGIGALTIDAVAKASGISKGGVQYAFGTKDDLIGAMIDRWEAEFDAETAALRNGDETAQSMVQAHAEATRHFDEASVDRAAVMLAAMMQDRTGWRVRAHGTRRGSTPSMARRRRGADYGWRSWRRKGVTCCGVLGSCPWTRQSGSRCSRIF
jgi:AcrR family transcriptional regulator